MLFESQFHALLQRTPSRLHGDRRPGGNLLRESYGFLQEPVCRYQPVQEPNAIGFFGLHKATGVNQVGVVGAGAGGVELTLAMQFRLRQLLQAAGRTDTWEYHLFSASATILPTHNRRVRATFRRVLAERGVQVHEGCRVIEVGRQGLRCTDGSVYRLDEILWVTDAMAPGWLAAAGLAVDDRGFVLVDAALQSVSHPEVFAAGDVAAVVPYPREKAGVIAVRQGQPLTRNLRRVLRGRTPHPFVPQKKWLALISTGDKYAVASRGCWSIAGQWVWRWKDWLDRRFMRKYTVFPAQA